MYARFLTFIGENGLFQPHHRLLLAVSGGVDSMVMAHLVQQAGYAFEVAHVNYGLRGAESDADEALVKGWCEGRGVICHVRQVLPEEYETDESLQMSARRIRYQFYEKLKNKYGFDRILTAHHANDNLETVLFNLTKGTGISGLLGIAPLNDDVARPLLFASRAEILAYAKTSGITWREDASNQKNDYARNLIRNTVIPQLRMLNPAMEQTFQDTLLRVKGASEVLQERVSEVQAQCSVLSSEITIPCHWVGAGAADLTVLSELLRQYGFGFDLVKDIQRGIIQKAVGARFISPTHELVIDREQLVVLPLQTKVSVNEPIEAAQTQVSTPFGTFSFQQLEVGPPIDRRLDVAMLDADLLRFPLTLRSWQAGDWFVPLGMKGRKLVSDFLIDQKVPLTQKRKVLVLTTGKTIVWVVGYRIDDRFKLTEKTRRIFRMEYGQ